MAVEGRSVIVPTKDYKKFNNEDKIAIKYYKVDQQARLNGSSVINFISWNTMGSTTTGYASLRKRTFSLISTHSPTDIWLLQEPFSLVGTTLLQEMGLHGLDPLLYNFAVENTRVSREHACIVYNQRKLQCLTTATDVLVLVREIIQQEHMEYTLASRLCIGVFRTIDDGTRTIIPTTFIVVSYHAVHLESDETKLIKIRQFHELCRQVSMRYTAPVIMGSDYNIDIRVAGEGAPAFVHILNYAACRTRNNVVIVHNDDDERIDATKIDYFAIISQRLILPRICIALPVLILHNPTSHPYSGHEYATETEAESLFLNNPHLLNLQFVSNHDPLFLSIDLGN